MSPASIAPIRNWPSVKAKVEPTVQIVQRFVLARLHNRRFFSLVQLNAAIRERVADLNVKIIGKLGGVYSRRTTPRPRWRSWRIATGTWFDHRDQSASRRALARNHIPMMLASMETGIGASGQLGVVHEASVRTSAGCDAGASSVAMFVLAWRSLNLEPNMGVEAA
jgi:hypothetical protein